MKKNRVKLSFSTPLLFLASACFVLVVFLFPLNSCHAASEIPTFDSKNIWTNTKKWMADKASEAKKYAWKKAGANAFHAALRSALNTMAYDTATYLGSGGRGQEPLFVKENWGEYLRNVGDNAAGTFIEELGKDEEFFGKFNLCEPESNIKARIGLGLKQYQRPDEPDCSFTEMKNNWEESLRRPDFLGEAGRGMFSLASTDLGASLVTQTNMWERMEAEKTWHERQRQEEEGWLDVRNIAGERLSLPRQGKQAAEQQQAAQTESFGARTGDAFVDATNIFLNQLAIQMFQRLMSNIGKDVNKSTSPYSGDYGNLSSYESDPSSSRSEYQSRVRKLQEPQFNTRGDYDVLFELTNCPDPENPGPTNCVISDRFQEAISNNLTVGQAMEQGYLNPEGTFGFSSGNMEPRYNEAYPYRSMLILRKFRIVPVGWELAAQYIRENFEDVGGSKNLEQMLACYDKDDDYTGYYEDWCEGLVDPDWVLKAPQNYCAREGPGPIINSRQVTGEEEESRLNISRDDGYCADEQTCIQRSDKGSCEYYGYCTEDRRMWQFDADSCDPQYNTCQTFRSPDGEKASYLKNTLDYGVCNSDNAGCSEYALAETGIDYNSDTDSVTWSDSSEEMYFDGDVSECDPDSEGCHEFIRAKSGAGTNLLTNSSFEDAGGISSGISQVNGGFHGEKAGELTSGEHSYTIQVGASDYSVRGEPYSLSLYSRDCGSSDTFDIDGQGTSTDLNTSSNWSRQTTSYVFPQDYSLGEHITLNFNISSSDCKIDAIKLERGEEPSSYTRYGEDRVYEKLLPAYLEETCYRNPGIDHRFQEDAPDICDQYARKCNRDEVGCQLYTSRDDDYEIVAKTTAHDHCPEECVGFDTYIQKETFFDSSRPDYFIPETADTCGAETLGCDEFTNLDKLESGAEEKEYYSQLRRCVDENDPAADCAEFYTWEGTAGGGEELVSFTLKVEDGDTNDPAAISHDPSECNQTIFELPPTDPDYNPNCRQFYNQAGDVSYRLIDDVITCSDDCHPYRRTRRNIDENLTTSAQCSASGSGYSDVDDDQFYWDSSESDCYFCKGGGTWSDQHEACIYMAVPGEGRTCSASEAGCREYNGNQGNNSRILFSYGFETDEEAEDWEGGDISDASVVAGEQSFHLNGDKASNTLPVLPSEDRAYNLKFLAKAEGDTADLDIYFTNGDQEANFREVEVIPGEWRLYETNLTSLDHEIDYSEALVIEKNASADLYIDDFRLTEITDRYYLIKDSWETPASCNQDIYGNPYELYMLGCEAYNNNEGDTEYIHNFDSLCQDSAIGCEMMIDTQNSSDPEATTSTAPYYSVPSDEFVYAAYDPDKRCDSSGKGCERMGKLQTYEDQSLYQDIYIKNDPDQYDEIICSEDAVGCQAWSTEDQGDSFFKDPGNQVCEWRQKEGEGGGETSWGWYKKQISRCDIDSDGSLDENDPICGSSADCEHLSSYGECDTDDDCGSGNKCVDGNCHYSCIREEEDKECPTDIGQNLPPKTLGKGGAGNKVAQPLGYMDGGEWVGVCPSGESGCTEYIDPESKFNPNLFDDRYDNPTAKLNPYTLYYDEDDNLSGGSIYRIGSRTAGSDEPELKYYYGDERTDFTGDKKDVLREAVVDYRIREGVDRSSCNGVYNFSEGCVLFNERDVQGGQYAELTYNAIDSEDGDAPSNSGTLDSNALLNVQPDRGCAEWLACSTYTKNEDGDNICLDIGRCTSLDNSGDCDYFMSEDKPENQSYDSDSSGGGNLGRDDIYNLTGYSLVGQPDGAYQKVPNDLYKLGDMDQVGRMAKVSNGSFESAGDNGYPVGWSPADDEGEWKPNIYSVIDNPVDSQEEGVDYPVGYGRNFLRLSPNMGSVISEPINIQPNTEYVLSARINTENFGPGSGNSNAEAVIRVLTYDETGGSTGDNSDFITCEGCDYDSGSTGEGGTIFHPAGEKWEELDQRFKVGGDTHRLKIELSGMINSRSRDCDEGDELCSGNSYFDDIDIRPALEVRNEGSDSIREVTDSCRLYPKDDSLACEYYEDSGKRQKGQRGYCLQYDRSPGNSDACLLWWPVDLIRGQSVEDPGAGYRGEFPLYYCTEIEPFNIDMTCETTAQGDTKTKMFDFPLIVRHTEGRLDEITAEEGGANYSTYGLAVRDEETKEWTDIVESDVRDTKRVWEVGEDFPGVERIDGFKYKCVFGDADNDNCECSEFTLGDGLRPTSLCTELSQVVTPTGQNKYWSNRVYEGSKFEVRCNNVFEVGRSNICSYPDLIKPFSSTERGESLYNPWEWDSLKDKSLKQPIIFGDREDELNTRSVYEKYHLKRLFAQSYNIWDWSGDIDDGAYELREGEDWEPPDERCSGGRPEYKPEIFNVQGTDPAGNPVDLNLPATYSTQETGSDFYNYNVDEASSEMEERDIVQSDRSNIFVHYNELEGVYSVGFLHDQQDDGDGGAALFGFDTHGNSYDITAEDDVGDISRTGDLDDGTVDNGDAWEWRWAPCCTDGGMIEMPSGDWSITIDPSFSTAGGGQITEFGVAYKGESSSYFQELDMNQEVTLSRETDNFDDYCAIPPEIRNIKVNGRGTGDINVAGAGYVDLVFNTIVDSQQKPLRELHIKWGDDTESIVSESEIRNRESEDDPHFYSHLYDYQDLNEKGKCSGGVCEIRPEIKIKDNWGWCNNGTSRKDCDQWETFSGTVRVYDPASASP